MTEKDQLKITMHETLVRNEEVKNVIVQNLGILQDINRHLVGIILSLSGIPHDTSTSAVSCEKDFTETLRSRGSGVGSVVPSVVKPTEEWERDFEKNRLLGPEDFRGISEYQEP